MKELNKNLKFAWQYAKDVKTKIYMFIFLDFIQIIVSIILPVLSAKIIVLLTSNELKQVLYLAIILFLIQAGRNIIDFFTDYYIRYSYKEILKKLQMDLSKTILKLKNSCIEKTSSGLFIQRITGDTTKIADIFNTISLEVTSIITDIGIFAAILIIDFRVFIFILILVFIIGIIERKRIQNRITNEKTIRKENDFVTGFVGELVRGAKDIKMLSAEKSFLNETNKKITNLNEKRYNMFKIQRNFRITVNTLKDFQTLAVITLLLYFISKDEITIAYALVIHNYVGKLSYAVKSISNLVDSIKDFNLSCNRIFEIMHSDNYPKERFGKKHINNIKGNFEFKNVSFSYIPQYEVLKDLSFKVEEKSMVAFVGKSGSGKSTIFNLLCKMYDTKDGKILIDGININELDRESIRDNITIISQNPYIFNLSIRDNLKIVKEDLTEEEMIDACKKACLDDFINSLPNKYDTIVGEGGINLSGGERQRLAIAREKIKKTEIILFDEATSALDNVTQLKIKKAIENMQNDFTILIIAHRLSTIINCDRILFLEDGKICAEGNHNDLLKNCEKYKELYDMEIEK